VCVTPSVAGSRGKSVSGSIFSGVLLSTDTAMFSVSMYCIPLTIKSNVLVQSVATRLGRSDLGIRTPVDRSS
jgi:hypothetical protein